MNATQIRPDADRENFVAAIRAADRLVAMFVLTEDRELMQAGWMAQREAHMALERFDKGQK